MGGGGGGTRGSVAVTEVCLVEQDLNLKSDESILCIHNYAYKTYGGLLLLPCEGDGFLSGGAGVGGRERCGGGGGPPRAGGPGGRLPGKLSVGFPPPAPGGGGRGLEDIPERKFCLSVDWSERVRE